MNSNDTVDQIEYLIKSIDGMLNYFKEKETMCFGPFEYYKDKKFVVNFRDIVQMIKSLNLQEKCLSKFNQDYQETVLGDVSTFSECVNGSNFGVDYLPHNLNSFLDNLREMKMDILNEKDKFLSKQIKRYLVLKDDVFYYNGDELKLGNLTYLLLKVLYTHLDGRSGLVLYPKFFTSARKEKKLKNASDKEIKRLFQKYISAKRDSLMGKLKPTGEDNKRPLISIQKGVGIELNNERS